MNATPFFLTELFFLAQKLETRLDTFVFVEMSSLHELILAPAASPRFGRRTRRRRQIRVDGLLVYCVSCMLDLLHLKQNRDKKFRKRVIKKRFIFGIAYIFRWFVGLLSVLDKFLNAVFDVIRVGPDRVDSIHVEQVYFKFAYRCRCSHFVFSIYMHINVRLHCNFFYSVQELLI